MIPLTAPPRDHLSESEVRDLLVSPDITVAAGLELLDSRNRVVEDISDDLGDGGTVNYDAKADVHGGCSLTIARSLAWGRDRVRPYLILSNATTSARFNLGVYVLTTPQTKRGEDAAEFAVQGYDLLHLLLDKPGDTYVIAAGTGYLEAVAGVIAAAGVGVPVLLDGDRASATLPVDMVWALTDNSPATWLLIANDLLAPIGYTGLWADEDGNFRAGPYRPPAQRAAEWTFDLRDARTSLVGEDRTVDEDVWSSPNWWRFVRRDMTVSPLEGDGIYTVENLTSGASSQESIGRVRRRVEFLDAVDQASLVAQAGRIVAEDMAATRTVTLAVDPLPIGGHLDVVRYVDTSETGVESVKAEVRSREIPLDGSAGRWVLEVVPDA